MSAEALARGLRLSLAHAQLALALDDEIGTHHGIAWADLIVLGQLAAAPGGELALPELARATGQQASALLRQLLPMEKLGMVSRGGEARRVRLTTAGRRLQREAGDSAGWVCERYFAGLDAAQGGMP